MTREEALQILDTIPTIGEQVDALEMAIEALEQEPCEDCISRQAVLEPYKYLKDDDVISIWLIKKNIEQQKSVIPIRPKGHWICIGDYHIGKFKCSVCQTEGFPNTVMYEPTWNYCPNCGAEMKEGE